MAADRFVQDLHTVNNIVIRLHLAVPNPHTLSAPIPTESKLLTVIALCSAFFSIPVDKVHQYLFAFTWEGQQYI